MVVATESEQEQNSQGTNRISLGWNVPNILSDMEWNAERSVWDHCSSLICTFEFHKFTSHLQNRRYLTILLRIIADLQALNVLLQA